MDQSAEWPDKCVLGMDERLLLEKAKKDDHDAFNRLVNPHAEDLRRWCIHICRTNSVEPDDLYVITLGNAYRNLRTYRGEQKIQGWLYQIMLSALVEGKRRNQTQKRGR